MKKLFAIGLVLALAVSAVVAATTTYTNAVGQVFTITITEAPGVPANTSTAGTVPVAPASATSLVPVSATYQVILSGGATQSMQFVSGILVK